VRLRPPAQEPLIARRWVKIGGLALPATLIGAWAFVQTIGLLAASAMVAVQLGWSGGLADVLAFVRVERPVRWLAVVPLQVMIAIAAPYGLWLVGLFRWRLAQSQGALRSSGGGVPGAESSATRQTTEAAPG